MIWQKMLSYWQLFMLLVAVFFACTVWEMSCSEKGSGERFPVIMEQSREARKV